MFLGIDVGTSSLKVVLSDRNGKIVATESATYDIYLPKEGWTEQNPNDWYQAEIIAIKRLGKKFDLSKIIAVSFCGQMHGLVLLDKNDYVIRPAILWNDNRTIDECKYLNEKIGKTKLIHYTGNIAFTGFTAPKILWVKKHEPHLFKKIHKIMLPKDYAAYKMSAVFASDFSDSSGTLYLDVKHKCWSKPMLDILEITEKQLPQLFESYQVIGNVSLNFAKLTGMSTKTKIIIGGGDQAVGAVGTGTVDNNQLSISLGTSGVVFAASQSFKSLSSGAMHSFCHANGRYHIMGVMLSAAGAFDWWLKNILKTNDFTLINKEMKMSQADNLYFLPYLTGERSPINNPYARGEFHNLALTHNRGDMSRAIIEGINFGLLDCLNSITALKIKPKVARVIGGGAKSEIWLQMLADILNIEVSKINTSEGGALGAIILAMVGTGRYKSISIACKQIIRDVQIFKPNLKKHQYYLNKFRIWKKLYLKLYI